MLAVLLDILLYSNVRSKKTICILSFFVCVGDGAKYFSKDFVLSINRRRLNGENLNIIN